MNKKSSTDTTLADFKRRFSTPDDLVAFLLKTPPDRKVTAEQLHQERAAQIAPEETDSKANE